MKKTVLALGFILFCLGLTAQKQVLNDVLKAKSRGTGAIIKDNAVTGYFSFFQLDKKDKKTRNYQLNIYDQNLSPLSNKKFSSQENLSALEASYNGELLLIKFYDEKEKTFVFKSYDQNAQQINSTTLSAKKEYDPYAAFAGGDDEGEEQSLTPIEGLGFVHFVVKREGGQMSHTYNEITFIPDAKGAKGWTWETPEDSKDFEWGDVLGSNGKVLMCLVNKRHKFTSSDIEDFILGLDIATGKKLFEYPLEDKTHAISTLNAITDPNGNFQLFGLYFDKDAKTGKAASKGLFGFTVDPTGKVVNRKYQSWEKDVSKFLKVSAKGKIEDIGYVYFHKFVRTVDNKIFAIAEQYKVNTGATVALTLLTGSATMNIDVKDMFVFEFDNTFDLKNVTPFEKTKSSYTYGVLTGGSRMTGMFLKYMGDYDYSFTQMSKDKSKFSVGYVDYDKKKGDSGWYFGSINYGDGKLTTDKVKFDKKATWQYVYPGKPGYVMISEYYKKEKKLEFRMEKLNF